VQSWIDKSEGKAARTFWQLITFIVWLPNHVLKVGHLYIEIGEYRDRGRAELVETTKFRKQADRLAGLTDTTNRQTDRQTDRQTESKQAERQITNQCRQEKTSDAGRLNRRAIEQTRR